MGNKTIAKIVEHAEIRERERIIKLLENNCDINHDHFYDKCSCYPNIALIKGEQK